ncbi:zeta toxin family protein [Streptomyces lydicus]|uniref:zeta toxin family protein n=1 Tax=Streptomyces lydicus TaxID=47763 RepID=UPI001F515767|nr:zeta toxin family protein [Streptomyces lydicus]MCZ1012632.1 zeta toxin family protein [Streptomyces lydicus]
MAVPDLLSEQESLDALQQVILPAATKGAVRQERPVVVIVGGQPGAGKTEVADLVQAALDRRGGAVRVCRDFYKAVHPRYAKLLAADVRTAGALVRPDTRRCQAAVEERVRSGGFDAVVESALADADEFRASAAAYRGSGCRLELVAVSTAEAWSQLGTLDRFLTEHRYVSWTNHDTCAKEMLQTLAVIEAEQLVDRITVVRRDGTVLYDNELIDGSWRRKPAADQAVADDRGRPWSARETAVFRRDLARTDQRLHREVECEDRRLAVQRDAERAAALAEPVRRIAQPRREPPGVDYHRLSQAEHQWIYDELIAPPLLGGIVPRTDPRAVYVIGQPGANKAALATMVHRAMRPGTTRLVGDDFKTAHPDYLQLLQDDPRGAGAAIRADYRAWYARGEATVRARRGDALLEAAPGSAEEFLASALPFATDGYPVEVVVVAAREADSRLATALRYARAQQLGIPARFTTKAGHDRCFAAVPDVVELAASHPAITAVTVIRRDGQALLRQEQGSGRRAVWALAAERQRPYTEQEATHVLTLHAALRKALPQHRRELDEIVALARPLMPAGLQPARIDRPHPPLWPLPLPRQTSGYGLVSSLSRAA